MEEVENLSGIVNVIRRGGIPLVVTAIAFDENGFGAVLSTCIFILFECQTVIGVVVEVMHVGCGGALVEITPEIHGGLGAQSDLHGNALHGHIAVVAHHSVSGAMDMHHAYIAHGGLVLHHIADGAAHGRNGFDSVGMFDGHTV